MFNSHHVHLNDRDHRLKPLLSKLGETEQGDWISQYSMGLQQIIALFSQSEPCSERLRRNVKHPTKPNIQQTNSRRHKQPPPHLLCGGCCREQVSGCLCRLARLGARRPGMEKFTTRKTPKGATFPASNVSGGQFCNW